MSLFAKAIIILMASSVLSFAAQDYPGPHRPLTSNVTPDFNALKGMDANTFAQMPLSDRRLRQAYSAVFMGSIGAEFHFVEPELKAAVSDLRRRGDLVTPTLLNLMEQNQETSFESCVIGTISGIGTIELGPYVEYARRVLRERTGTMSASLAGASAMLLSEQGGQDDLDLLRQVIAKRPYVAAAIKSELPLLEKRIAGMADAALNKEVPKRPVPPLNMQTPVPEKATEPKLAPSTSDELPSSTPWSMIVVLIVAALGLLLLLLKRRS